MPEIFVESGQTVDLSMVVCADPRPRSVAWEWGSLRLEAGNEMGKFKVDDLTQEDGEDCYLTTLHVKDTSATDSRTYYLLVENDKGKDTHAVQLYVNEPLQMITLVSVAGALLVGCLLLVCVCIYAIRAGKCCFSTKMCDSEDLVVKDLMQIILIIQKRLKNKQMDAFFSRLNKFEQYFASVEPFKVRK
ncbi:unnamed protein product [Ceutorhynchus assimilis]|uniref:Immunoglobulin I-set domain-containing protein n=1 Tax=Ceutorhynchus assimilis TaxID=467358 RepID=A0A9N9MGH5_9CUCU|nr:unnamed protein product [Ceutorhynchus assimilis]